MADLLQEFMYLKEGVGIILNNIDDINKKLDDLSHQLRQSRTSNIITQEEIKAIKQSLEEKSNPYRIPAGRGDCSGEWCSADGSNSHTGGGGGGSSNDRTRGENTINHGKIGNDIYKAHKEKIGKTEKIQKPKRFDVDKATDYLHNHVSPKTYGDGKCATNVANAIRESVPNFKAPPIRKSEGAEQPWAKDYGDSLTNENVGFKEIAGDAGVYPPIKGNSSDKYTPKKGDVVVIQSIPNHDEGHIAMYDGKKWFSDFPQDNDIWSNRDYQKHKATYKIYRHEGQM